jgi:hypothetical protein
MRKGVIAVKQWQTVIHVSYNFLNGKINETEKITTLLDEKTMEKWRVE